MENLTTDHAVGDRVYLTQTGTAGQVVDHTRRGWPIVEFDGMHPGCGVPIDPARLMAANPMDGGGK